MSTFKNQHRVALAITVCVTTLGCALPVGPTLGQLAGRSGEAAPAQPGKPTEAASPATETPTAPTAGSEGTWPAQAIVAPAQGTVPGATAVTPPAAQPAATAPAAAPPSQPPTGTQAAGASEAPATQAAGAVEAPGTQPAPAAAPVAPTRVVMREQAPNIRFLDAGGQAHTLDEWKGKYVVLLFFSKDCGVCAHEVPKIQAFASLRGPNGVVLPIESTTGTAQQAAGFAALHGVTIPVYHDPTWEAPRAFMVRKFPQAYVVAPDHTVIEDVAGEASVEFYDIRYRRYFPSIAPSLTPGV